MRLDSRLGGIIFVRSFQHLRVTLTAPSRGFERLREIPNYKVFNDSEGFGSLDIKFAVALKQICLKVLTRRVTALEEKWVDKHGTQFKGRQILVLLLQ